jgi:type I restriction enzyme S subunit
VKAGWEAKKLSECINKSETVNPKNEPDKAFTYIDVSSVSKETLRIEKTSELLGRNAPSRARRLVKTNNVIFATIRPTLKRIAVVPKKLDGQVCSTGYFVFSPKPILHSRFLYYFLQSDNFIDNMESLQKGASYPAVNDSQVKSQVIPIPPVPEQKRIAENLDGAFAKIDRLEVIVKRQIENENAYRETMLDSIFTSIEQDIDSNTHPLNDLAILKGRIGWKGLTAKEYTEEGPLFLSVHSLNYGDYVDYRDAFHISQERYDESPEIMLQKDDILICKDGAGIGKLGIVPEIIAPTTINSSLLLIRHADNLRAKYLYYCLLSPYFQKIVQSRLEGATTPHLYQRDIKDFPIHLCSLAKQDKVVAKLDLIFSKSKKYLKNQSQKLAALAELRQSLLKKAFAGELVDMADETVKPNTISIPANDNHTDHAGAITYADSYFRNAHAQTFKGKTTYEKVAQAAESIAGIDLGRQAFQGMRGPTDNQQRQAVEALAEKEGYFSFLSTGGKGFELKRGRKFNELRLAFEQKYQEQIPALDRFLSVIANMDTRDVEVLSTVHTAWNNYIIEGQTPTDEQIVTAAREGWHEEKEKIARPKFFAAIKTLRDKNLIPAGLGKYVGKTAGASLEF